MDNNKIVALDPWIVRQLSVEQLIGSYVDVVKELVENSIDAESTLIRIQIDFNKYSVEVVDNGIGMNEQDLIHCSDSYSTSKFTDFSSLSHLGFRGEGLFAIRESANLEITTRMKGALYGYQYCLDHTNNSNNTVEKVASNKGTTVKVSNLFFKIPNRRLFINSRLELIQIVRTIEQLAISHPEIKFLLFKEKKNLLTISNNQDPIEQIFHIQEQTVLYIDGGEGNFSIKIIINRNPKEKKGKLLLYVNRRPVQDCGILYLIRKHIETQVGESNLSFLIVFLTIDRSMVNCNLVPDKSRLKIMNLEAITKKINEFFQQPIVIKKANKLYDHSSVIFKSLNGWFVYENKFIFANYNNKVYVIDQHGISERILFNKLIEQSYESQLLLDRVIVKLTIEEILLMDSKEIRLRELKFLFHRIDNYLLVYSVPEFIDCNQIENIIHMLLNEEDAHIFLHKVSEFACKNSMKGGVRVNEQEILKFLEYIETDSKCAFCNHGRNTTFIVDKSQIHKWFNIK